MTISINKHPLKDKLSSCTGCAACAGVCPQNAITMQPNAEGFTHPQIDPSLCNNCNLCRRICPVNGPDPILHIKNLTQARINPPEVLAAWHTDDTIRHVSSSGGVFTALAKSIFDQEGVVAGVVFTEDLEARHILTDNPEDLPRLRGSKYVQSAIAPEIYPKIKAFLEQVCWFSVNWTNCSFELVEYFN